MRATRLNSCRKKRQQTRISQTLSTRTTASTATKINGCATAAHRPSGTRPSSIRDAPTLLNGSGDVLMAARVVALAVKLVAASVPPRSAATKAMAPLSALKTLAASAAPAGIRMTLCTTSHSESSPGILSAKNSINTMKPLAPSTTGLANKCKPCGRLTQPINPANPVSKTTRYRRMPLAQPSAPARAIN